MAHVITCTSLPDILSTLCGGSLIPWKFLEELAQIQFLYVHVEDALANSLVQRIVDFCFRLWVTADFSFSQQKPYKHGQPDQHLPTAQGTWLTTRGTAVCRLVVKVHSTYCKPPYSWTHAAQCTLHKQHMLDYLAPSLLPVPIQFRFQIRVYSISYT